VDARDAVRAFHAEVAQADMALVVFFCSPQYDLDVLAQEVGRLFAGVQVVGCTTAGEIGPHGCCEHSLTGFSLGRSSFAASGGVLDDLKGFELTQAEGLGQRLLTDLQDQRPGANPESTFALLLTDGLSVREEPVTRVLQHVLGDIRVVGGSAGDDLRFGRTFVYADGRFWPDSAVLVLVSTRLPFEVFNTQHFLPTDRRVVVTAADVPRRIVHELDGWPAAEAYARLVGADVDDLDPMRFATWPMVVMIDGTNYVRSIQKAGVDGSLTFFCAIEEGLVLRTAVGTDLVAHLKGFFDDLEARIGPPELVIAFDCILRKQEMTQRGLVDSVGGVFRQNNVIGFNSYGEQFAGVHVNQTLTGVAIGGLRHA
jgi:hypothetical protein